MEKLGDKWPTLYYLLQAHVYDEDDAYERPERVLPEFVRDERAELVSELVGELRLLLASEVIPWRDIAEEGNRPLKSPQPVRVS
jgi:hypothetical protein